MKNAGFSLPLPPASSLRLPFVALAALLGVAGPDAVHADVVVLRNGAEIQGQVLEENEERIVVRFPGGVLELKHEQVSTIRRQRPRQYLLEIGEKQILRHDYAQAVETLSRALREHPGFKPVERKLSEARFKLAGEFTKRRRYAEALAIYHQLERQSPGNEAVRSGIDFIEDERADGLHEERRGRAEIESGDLVSGVWRLQKVRDTFPDRREALTNVLAGGLILQAEAFHERSRFEDAAERLDAALAIKPTVVDRIRDVYVQCKVELCTTLVEQDRFDEVDKLARQGLEIAPSDPTLNFFLALADDAGGETARAAVRYAAILGEPAPSRPRQVIDDLRRRAEFSTVKQRRSGPRLRQGAVLDSVQGEFRKIRTPHFEVQHRNRQIGRQVAFVAEQAYGELFRQLGCTTHWRSRCTIRIFPSKEEYVAEVDVGEWSGAAHRVDSRRGALSEHRICTYQGQPRLADGLLRHEIAHALLLHRLNYPRDLPLWANEGFAVFVEPSYMHRHYDRICLDARNEGQLIPLRDLLRRRSYPAGEVEIFYAQSYSLVRYLIEKKSVARFIDFLRDITALGLTVEDALGKRYRTGGETALENRWRTSLKARG